MPIRRSDCVSLRRYRDDPVHLFHDAPSAVEIPAETARFPMAEVTLGEDFAGRKLDEHGGDLPSGARLRITC
jgi:hypothetical protein